MPRFYFHAADGSRDRDEIGTELESQAEARQHAIAYLGDCLRLEPKILSTGRDFRIEVTGSDDLILFTIIVLAVSAPAARDIPEH